MIIITRMNVVDNLNSVQVINKPCVYSSTMRLSTFCGLHRDTEQLHIYMAQFPWPFLSPCWSPFVSSFTYLAPSSCDRNRPPPSQVACKLTPFAPPFNQLSHPFQIPRTPTAPRLTMTTSGIFRLLLSGTDLLHEKTLTPC
jgi:hypothetical protein